MASVYKPKKDRQRRGSRWLIAYTDETGRRRVCRGCSDRSASEQIARHLETEVELRRRGVHDPVMDRLAEHGKRPIETHVDDYREYLAGKGNTRKRVTRVINAINDARAACGWESISEIDGPALRGHLRSLESNGLGLAAINGRLQAVRSFTRWLTMHRRLASDPLASERPRRTDTDRRRTRRALTDDELRRLLAVADYADDLVRLPKRYRSKGKLKIGTRRVCVPHRAMLYRVAVETGFRLGELRSLTPRSFLLEHDPPTIVVRAAYSKRRREDTQPIRLDLARVLRPWLAGLDPEDPVWGTLPDCLAQVVAVDLRAAGISHTDAEGRVLDFHAFRHTFITRVVASGVSPKVAQSLARHSDINLTMNRYAHVRLADEARALEALPAIEVETASLVGTGTDGFGAQRQAQRTGRTAVQPSTAASTGVDREHSSKGRGRPDRNSPGSLDMSAAVRDDAGSCTGEGTKATRETRTRDLSFTKAPLYQLS